VLGRADAALGLLLMVFVANPLLSAACERPAHRRARRQRPRPFGRQRVRRRQVRSHPPADDRQASRYRIGIAPTWFALRLAPTYEKKLGFVN
jgi:hypothetical protein